MGYSRDINKQKDEIYEKAYEKYIRKNMEAAAKKKNDCAMAFINGGCSSAFY